MSADPRGGAPAPREALLASKAGDYGLLPTTELPHVWAALMEMQVSDAVVSLVAVADGTTSMYFSKGGGIIGGHAHEAVRAANRKFLVGVERFFTAKAFVARDRPAEVMKGAVAFAVLTYEGLVVARDTEERLKTRASPLWPLFFLGHEAIAALRGSTEGKAAG